MIWLFACTTGPAPQAPAPTTARTVSAGVSGYDQYDGWTVEVRVTDRRTLALVDSGRADVVGGEALVELAVAEGTAVFVDLWVDKNDNAGCDAEDGTWHFEAGPSGDVDAVKTLGDASALDATACWGFPEGDLGVYDLQLTGFGYIVHMYEDAYLVLIDDSGTAVAEAQDVADNQSATWSFDDVVEPGVSYRVAFYLEHDGDGACSDGDHLWFQDLGSFSGHAVVELGHPYEAFDLAVCEYF